MRRSPTWRCSGYKRFPDELFNLQKGDRKGIPAQIIYDAAGASAPIKDALQESGWTLEEVDLVSLVDTIKSTPRERLAETRPVQVLPGQSVSAEFILEMLSSELVRDDAIVFDGSWGYLGTEEMVEVVPEVEARFSSVYSGLEQIRYYGADERTITFDDISFQLAEYPLLFSAAKISLASVSLGKIFAFPAKEKKLSLEPSTLRKYDVYWIEFPLTLRDMEEDSVGELRFQVILPPECVALALVPLRYGVETTVVERRASPDVTVDVEGVAVSVGEFYGRTVEYTVLKPTVVATGLRDYKFSWVMTGDAVGTGSYLFVGIIGVPKGWNRLTAGFNVEAEVETYLGLQGDITGTGVVFDQIELQTENLEEG